MWFKSISRHPPSPSVAAVLVVHAILIIRRPHPRCSPPPSSSSAATTCAAIIAVRKIAKKATQIYVNFHVK